MSAWVESTEKSYDNLWATYEETKSEKVREKILMKYLPLVRQIAGGIIGKLPSSVSVDDLIDAGVIGLLESIDRFDTNAAVKFETYAYTRVRGAMMDELRKMDWAPRSLREKSKRVKEAYRTLVKRHGRQPDQDEIANELEVPIEKFHQINKEIVGVNLMSLDQEVTSNSGESTSLYDVIAEKDTVEPIEAMEDRELKDRMIIEIEKLPKNEKLVIALYYYEELTLKEIGKILDLSESRISQIHSKVVKDLKIRLEL
ncbi:MAG: FliA/WhiG family RNA polymerase sigma factor [Candidatus Marinimicrobia bacterium]|nr:FliA/WhiG family RNA polymerase sigma factor [Candidatus Neomarinimicrobiota bacterium]